MLLCLVVDSVVLSTANAEDSSGLVVLDADIPEIIDATMPTNMNTG